MLGDDALICAQRLSEWVANAPELEEEVALANTALDLLGQARVLLARAAHLGAGADEDALAFQRAEAEFRNVALAEIGDDLDFARAVARLLIFSTWRLALLERLVTSRDPVLAAVAGKGVKELAYHRDHAAQLDGPARRRHRRLAHPHAGRARRRLALRRRAVPHLRGRGPAARRGGRSRGDAGRGRRRPRRRCSPPPR